MDFPRPTIKLLAACGMLVCLGAVAMSFGVRTVSTPLHPTYDASARIEPMVRTVAYVVGAACIFMGAICLVAKRRRMALLGLALAGAFIGAIAGAMTGNALNGGGPTKSETDEQQSNREMLTTVGLILGGVSVPFAAALASARKCAATELIPTGGHGLAADQEPGGES